MFLAATGTIALVVVIIVILVIIAIALFAYSRTQRRRQLRQQFGPEYDRAVQESGSRARADQELQGRLERHQQLDIRALPEGDRERYLQDWSDLQTRFVDAPSQAVREADLLVIEVMRARGYPMDDFEQRAADVSVDHPDLVQNYREAHQISLANDQNMASTEDLRRALVHYRSLFNELLQPPSGGSEGTPGTA